MDRQEMAGMNFKRVHRLGRQLIAAAALANAIGFVSQGQAHETPFLPTVTIKHPNAPVTTKSSVATSKYAYLGSAPYICTYSGFGKTASCFLRASLQNSK
ncbi:hypothetical protein [Mesorhizobium erdmanii]|uniref:hypothetical protein n=1 Tax=Mesorhizobium erdmanii TaxID=1777866 RepID=UPI000B0DD883|nr:MULTISPECIES: hypothetical protein [Mesorhizobium]